MKISEINITPVRPHKGMIGIASIVVNDEIYLNSIAIFRKLDGSFRLLYPTKQLSSKQVSLFNPINAEASKQIERAIFKRCNEVFERSSNHDRHGKARADL